MKVRIPARLSRFGEAYHKEVGIDKCIAPLVQALNDAGLVTEASCCGHSKQPAVVILEEDMFVMVLNREQYELVSGECQPINPLPPMICKECGANVLCPRCC